MHLLPLKLQLLAFLSDSRSRPGWISSVPPTRVQEVGRGGSHPAPSSSVPLPAASWGCSRSQELGGTREVVSVQGTFWRAASHAVLQQDLGVCSVHRAVCKDLSVCFPPARWWHSRCRSLLMGHSLHFSVVFYELWAAFSALPHGAALGSPSTAEHAVMRPPAVPGCWKYP